LKARWETEDAKNSANFQHQLLKSRGERRGEGTPSRLQKTYKKNGKNSSLIQRWDRTETGHNKKKLLSISLDMEGYSEHVQGEKIGGKVELAKPQPAGNLCGGHS